MGFCSTSNFRKKTKNWQENTHRSTKTCQEVNYGKTEHRWSDQNTKIPKYKNTKIQKCKNTNLSKDLEVLNDREQLGLARFHLTSDVLKQVEARPARKIFDNLRSIDCCNVLLLFSFFHPPVGSNISQFV